MSEYEFRVEQLREDGVWCAMSSWLGEDAARPIYEARIQQTDLSTRLMKRRKDNGEVVEFSGPTRTLCLDSPGLMFPVKVEGKNLKCIRTKDHDSAWHRNDDSIWWRDLEEYGHVEVSFSQPKMIGEKDW